MTQGEALWRSGQSIVICTLFTPYYGMSYQNNHDNYVHDLLNQSAVAWLHVRYYVYSVVNYRSAFHCPCTEVSFSNYWNCNLNLVKTTMTFLQCT